MSNATMTTGETNATDASDGSTEIVPECVVCFFPRKDAKQVCDCKYLLICTECQLKITRALPSYRSLTCPICNKHFNNVKHNRPGMAFEAGVGAVAVLHVPIVLRLFMAPVGVELLLWRIYVALVATGWLWYACVRNGNVKGWRVRTRSGGTVRIEFDASVTLV